MQTIDISAEVRSLCDKLGVAYDDTHSIVLTPNTATVSRYLPNENNHKFATNGKSVMTTETFSVKT